MLQGGLVLTKSGRLELGDNIFRTFFNPCDIIGQQKKLSNLVKRTQNKGYYAVQGQYKSKTRMGLPTYCFGVIAA